MYVQVKKSYSMLSANNSINAVLTVIAAVEIS